jgi:predicted glutamine amidotransferase
MCGLAGMAGTIDSDLKIAMFNDLIHLNSLRGEDSTGVACVDYRNVYNIFKALGPPINHWGYKKYDNVVSKGTSLLLGHARKATVGKLSVNNAHPFFFDNTLGMHNGTLDWASKNKLEGHTKTFDTDSESLMYGIDSNDSEWPEFEVKGAWAVAWFNFKKRTLNLARNEERTLWYTFTKDMKTLLFSSEQCMLNFVFNRYGQEKTEIKAIEPFTQKSFNIPERDEMFIVTKEAKKLPGFLTAEEKRKREKEKQAEEEERKKKWSSYGGGNNNYSSHHRNNQTSVISYLPPPSSKKNKNKNIEVGSSFVNHIGATLTEIEFKEASNKGCCGMCSEKITSKERYKWLSPDEVLCESCVEFVEQGITSKNGNATHDLIKETFPNFYQQLEFDLNNNNLTVH